MSLDRNTKALVTGASSGICEATARALRARGVKVYAAARRLDRLEKLAEETGCIPVQLDVRNRAAVMAFGKEQPVDILVNNAGLGRALGAMWKAEVADAIVYCVDAPWRVNVSQMEIVPTEQTYGGAQFVPSRGGTRNNL